MDRLTLSHIFRNIDTNGVFTTFTNGFFWGEDYDETRAKILDQILINEFGNRLADDKLMNKLDENDEPTTMGKMLIIQMYVLSQTKTMSQYYNLLSAQYNPIHNYDRTEEYESDTTGREDYTHESTKLNKANNENTNTNQQTSADTGNTKLVEEGNETNNETKNETNNNNAKVYGFNSSSAVNSDENNSTNKTTDETTNTKNNTSTNTLDTLTTINGTNNETIKRDETENINDIISSS